MQAKIFSTNYPNLRNNVCLMVNYPEFEKSKLMADEFKHPRPSSLPQERRHTGSILSSSHGNLTSKVNSKWDADDICNGCFSCGEGKKGKGNVYV